ncbi:hypothetical protein JCM11491_001378 [Sporobolomyces phaffii]
MSATNPRACLASGYECVNCSSPVDSLYISYFQQSNTSLLECPKCGQLADDFLSFPFPIALLNLLLLKPQVYRHLLRNRGGDTVRDRSKHQWAETFKLAAISLSVDSLVRCVPVTSSSDLQSLELFSKTFGYCFLETISLLVSTMVAAFLLRRTSRSNLSDLCLIPLALLYSALPTTFFLVVSSIVWRKEYLPSPSLSSPTPVPAALLLDLSPYILASNLADYEFASSWAKYIVSFSRANLKSGLAQVGSARGWASEAVLRKGVGGSSAVVAVSGTSSESSCASRPDGALTIPWTPTVVLRISKRRAVAVLGLAWAIHLVLLHGIDQIIA